MSFRITFVFAILALVVGGYVVLFELQKTTESEPKPLWFYNVRDDDIKRISITHRTADSEETLAFTKQSGKEFKWYFDDGTGREVDLIRWGGIPLLVTGPRSKRVLEDTVSDLTPYGLKTPRTIVEVTLNNGRNIIVKVGDTAPDGKGSYAQLDGFSALFLIDPSWGEVLSRLVLEPPVTPYAQSPAG